MYSIFNSSYACSVEYNFDFFVLMQTVMNNENCASRVNIIDGALINKDKRRELFGQAHNAERFQISAITHATGVECARTNVRINLRSYSLVSVARPNIKEDGFDYTENFDCVQQCGKKSIYINLKCIVGKGGFQTRSLREVYWFIEGQLNVLRKEKQNCNIYFANILDGDECARVMDKFAYLIMQDKNRAYSKKIYVGDLKNYITWFVSMNKY